MKTKKQVKRKNSSLKRRSKKSLHRRFLAHPAVIFCLLLSGVVLASFTLQSKAANLNVVAEVPAPLITQPAIITTPKDGDTFTAKPITVGGTCPSNSIIRLFRNNTFSGQVACDGSNAFSLQTDLFLGANKLIASVFNITGEQGPDSAPVNVTYNLPPSPPTTGSPSSSSGQAPAPSGSKTSGNPQFALAVNQTFKMYAKNEAVSLTLKPANGSPPYAYNIKWGDNNEENIAREDSQPFSITHFYKKAGNYIITINVSDALGAVSFFQTGVSVSGKTPSFKFVGTISGSWLQNLRSWLWVVWPLYLLILLMLISYWLGEREEYLILRKKGRSPKTRKA